MRMTFLLPRLVWMRWVEKVYTCCVVASSPYKRYTSIGAGEVEDILRQQDQLTP